MKLYKPKQMTVYYAHPMSWYGTDLERDDLGFLQTRFKNVINPGTAEFEATVQQWKALNLDVMGQFAYLIHSQADAIAYRTFKDGKLGAGVGREVFEARIGGKHIDRIIGGYERFKGEGLARWLIPSESLSIMNNVLTIDETRKRVHEGRM